jgi:hypothetical protein
MYEFLRRRLPILVVYIIIAAIVGGVSIAFASLTFSGTGISGDSGVVVDGSGTITIGTSSSTAITIGRSGITATFPGTVTITGSTTTLKNLVVSGTCTGCGVGNFTAGGDLSGSSTAQKVIGLQGQPISSTTPLTNQVLTWNGSFWTPTNASTTGGISAINGLSNSTTSIVGAENITVSTSSPNIITITGTGSGAIAINSLATSTFQIQGTANQITVATSSPNIISLSLPQNIGTTSIPIFGGLTINGNATTTSLTITGLGTSSSNCLTVNAAGNVATTTCGGTSTNYWSATSTGIYYNASGTVAIGTSLSVGASNGVWYVGAGLNGFHCDGVTDDTTALQTLLTEIYNAWGGTIFVNQGTCLIAGQIILPNNNTPSSMPNPYSRQPNLRITGVGDAIDGQGNGPGGGFGGSVLKLTYSGPGAQIETFGLGSLEIDHITLWSSTGSSPQLLTTGTTLYAHDGESIGNMATGGDSNADQDAFLLGGYNEFFSSIIDPTAAFQGYDSVITHWNFDYIRTAVYLKTYAAGVEISHNFIMWSSGSNLTGSSSAPFIIDGRQSGGNDVNNHLEDNRCELTYYYYCASFLGAQNNNSSGMDVEDATHGYNTAIYYLDSTSNGNLIEINSGEAPDISHVEDQTCTSPGEGCENTVIDSSQESTMALGFMSSNINFNSPTYFWNSMDHGNTTPATSSTPANATPFSIGGNYWNGTSSARDKFIFTQAFSTNYTNPESDLILTHTGSPGGTPSFKLGTGLALYWGSTNSTLQPDGSSILNGQVSLNGALNINGNDAFLTTNTGATSGSNHNSPNLFLTGRFWNGTASAVDQWVIYDALGSGSNPNDTLTIRDASSPSGFQSVSVPALKLSGSMAVGSLPACQSGFVGTRQLVNDANSAAPGTTAAGGGTYTIAVQCIYNSSGSVYTWIID